MESVILTNKHHKPTFMAINIMLVFWGKKSFSFILSLDQGWGKHFLKFHYLTTFLTNSHSKNGNFRDDPIGNEAGK